MLLLLLLLLVVMQVFESGGHLMKRSRITLTRARLAAKEAQSIRTAKVTVEKELYQIWKPEVLALK